MKITNVNEQNRKHPTNEEIINELIDYSYQKDAYQSEKIEGNLLFALIVEKARWLQFTEDEKRVMEKPKSENAYIGIAIHSTVDFHFIKDLIVMVSVFDHNGTLVGEHQHFYHPRPELHNYGRNWVLPGNGKYSIVVEVENLRNNDDMNPSVKFSNIAIQTGQHIS